MLARNRSVAIIAMRSPSTSTRTPVSSGSMSSRPAAATACATDAANASDATEPDCSGIAGRAG
jgi:hypothetical protein